MIDLIVYPPRVPAAGETILGHDFQLGFGGKGANHAVMARLLGAEVAMINALGDDVLGEMTVANFGSFGIDGTLLTRIPVPAAWRRSGWSPMARTGSSVWPARTTR